MDERLLVEGTIARNVINEDDGASHAAKAEHVGDGGGEAMLCDHFKANIGHERETNGDRVTRDVLSSTILLNEGSGAIGDDLHHWSGRGEKERHAIGELVLDHNILCRLLVQQQTCERTSVIREIVLNARVDHFGVVELQNEIENISELFRQCLLSSQSTFLSIRQGSLVVLHQGNQELGEGTFELL